MIGDDELVAIVGDVTAYRRDGELRIFVCGHPLVAHPDDGRRAVNDRTSDGTARLTRYLTPAELDDLEQVDAILAVGDPSANGKARLTHRPAAAITVEPPVWLWKCWLVAGAVQLLIGRQGSGKSTFAAWVVAQNTSGRPWPGETDHREPLRCGMLSLEEPADRLVARLTAAGAVLEAVDILGDVEDHDDDGNPFRRPWQLPGDCGALEATIVARHLALVTIDGLGYAVRGDSHNYANVGAALSALAGVAERTGCAILGLTHPPKGNSDAVTAAIGSTAWTAVARISWVMGGDPTDETKTRRVVRPAPGSNYRLPESGLSFTIAEHDETEAGYVTGLQASDVDPQTITSPPVVAVDDDDTVDAASALAEILEDGSVWVKEALDAMAGAGFSKDQAKRAKAKIGARSIKVGKPGDPVVGWQWALPQLRERQESEGSASPEGAPLTPLALPSESGGAP